MGRPTYGRLMDEGVGTDGGGTAWLMKFQGGQVMWSGCGSSEEEPD